ncbi:MAG: lipase family protein [Leptolyngbya sp. SIO3F4]|nr:lipase family protein [Leptolyngbya sp. SIO3F4]
MTFVEKDLLLTDDEKDIEQRLNSSPSTRIDAPAGFQLDIAWELANLTRVSYRDYEIFNEKVPKSESTDTLTENSKLCVSSQVSQDRIDKYIIVQNEDSLESHASIEQILGKGYYTYEILASYNYLAYLVGLPPRPDVDKFGFIAKRSKEDGSSLIFIIFRGTREPEEWFNNFQFKQIPFLMRSPSDTADVSISLGFNKIYTDYRPGIFMNQEGINQTSRSLDEKARNSSRKNYQKEHELHDSSIFDKIKSCLTKSQLKNPSIYLSGHSLGGALATISALHVARLLNISLSETQIDSSIELYTFASPRVGSPDFVKACDERFITYRIANEADVVPKVPLDRFRILRGPVSNWLSRGAVRDVYEHVGTEMIFESRLGGLGDNHNMSVTYCNALRNIAHNT